MRAGFRVILLPRFKDEGYIRRTQYGVIPRGGENKPWLPFQAVLIFVLLLFTTPISRAAFLVYVVWKPKGRCSEPERRGDCNT